MKELKINAIADGTVLDHVPSNVVFDIVRILKLEKQGTVVSVGMNLPSKKMGTKGLIKIGGKFLNQHEANKIAIIAPNASLCIIKNFKVEQKTQLEIPDEIPNVVKCSNPKCITNNEDVATRFYTQRKDPLKIKCHYCERSMEKDEIEIK